MTATRSGGPDWAALGELLETRREALGLTKREAARRAEVSETTWRSLEGGTNRSPSNEILSRVARTVQIPFQEVLRLAGRGDAPAAKPPIRRGRTNEALAAMLERDPQLGDRDRQLLLTIYDFLVAFP